MKPILSIAIYSLAMLITGFAQTAIARVYEGIWVKVDTDQSVTEIWDGNERAHVIDRVAFGRGGISDLHLRGDQTTPRGEFYITRVNAQSRFHLFLGINYPTLEHLDQAHHRGIINRTEYRQSLDYGLRVGEFPQDGTLGGYIGFHGIGEGNPAVHNDFHWTKGCIAMTNSQIEILHDYVSIGTPVIID